MIQASEKYRAQGYMMAVATLIQQHGMSTYARNVFEDYGLPFRSLRHYDIDPADMEVLRKHRKELMRNKKLWNSQ